MCRHTHLLFLSSVRFYKCRIFLRAFNKFCVKMPKYSERKSKYKGDHRQSRPRENRRTIIRTRVKRRERVTSSPPREGRLSRRERVLQRSHRECESYSTSSSDTSRSRSRSPVFRRIRRISSSHDDESASSLQADNQKPRASEMEGEDPSRLNDDILALLGKNVAEPKTEGVELCNDLAQRWMGILVHGISLEERNQIIAEYPTPKNCELLTPPMLNDIVIGAITDSATRRDLRLSLLQTQVAAATTAIGLVLISLLKNGGGGNETQIKQLSDASRLLVDLFHSESLSRRELVAMCLNKDLKDTLVKAPIDKLLFGADLENRIKTSKDMTRSSQTLKPLKPVSTFRSLNYKSLPRPLGTRPGRQPHQSQHNYRNQPFSQRQFLQPQQQFRKHRRSAAQQPSRRDRYRN